MSLEMFLMTMPLLFLKIVLESLLWQIMEETKTKRSSISHLLLFVSVLTSRRM